MYYKNIFSNEEIKNIEVAGIEIDEKKDYTREESRMHVSQISDFIMSHSSKNGDIPKLTNDLSGIVEKLLAI